MVDHRSSENKSGYMLGHPVESKVLVAAMVAVKILRGRAISRKDRTTVRNPQRLHARPHHKEVRMIQSVLHGNMQSATEMIAPVNVTR